MNYSEALNYIHGTYKFGSKLGLDNIKDLLNRLDNPQERLKVIHVAGTNGKGSTSSMISTVLRKSGYKTGLYTSPFIEVFNERMQIDGTMISDLELAELTEIVKVKVEEMVSEGRAHPTEFEIVTAIGFLYFEKNKCDVVVLEVGLGGRLDATNVVTSPEVAVITPIDLDHVAYLGDTIEQIAAEKAGIIKEKCHVVSYPQKESAMAVVKRVCEGRRAQLTEVSFETLNNRNSTLEYQRFEFEGKPYQLSLIAPYQIENAAVAIKTIDVLREIGYSISDLALQQGLKEAKWMVRMERVSSDPLVIIDGAHNVHGIIGLREMLRLHGKDYFVVGVMGVLEDKDVTHMLDIIVPELQGIITTKPDNPRAMAAEDLKKMIQGVPVLGALDSVESAMALAMKIEADYGKPLLIVCFGSLYMVGRARKWIIEKT